MVYPSLFQTASLRLNGGLIEIRGECDSLPFADFSLECVKLFGNEIQSIGSKEQMGRRLWSCYLTEQSVARVYESMSSRAAKHAGTLIVLPGLLALFAGAMTLSFGIKAPLNYSVFVDAAAALMLSAWPAPSNHQIHLTRA